MVRIQDDPHLDRTGKLMLIHEETFFTTIGCMDGRCQEAVTLYGQDRFGVQYPDTITEAGLVGLLAKENPDQTLLNSLKNKIDISLKHHHSKEILIFGHEDCAGNPVDDAKHREDILASVLVIRRLINDPSVSVVPLFVARSLDNDLSDWTAEEINESNTD